MKPRLLKIPQRGLSWRRQYANVGDAIEVWPLIKRKGERKSFYAVVAKVHRNQYGRISYVVTGCNRMAMTEELTPLGYDGVRA
jgi:hypothetical protein